jgi:hypothetical protein
MEKFTRKTCVLDILLKHWCWNHNVMVNCKPPDKFIQVCVGIWLVYCLDCSEDLLNQNLLTSTAVPNNTESPFGLVSSSHKPCHSTHARWLKFDTCRFSGTHLVVWCPDIDLVVCYSTSDRLSKFTNKIIENALSNQSPPKCCLIKSNTRKHRPHTMIKANAVKSWHHLGLSTHTSTQSRSQSPSKSLDTCALCCLCP